MNKLLIRLLPITCVLLTSVAWAISEINSATYRYHVSYLGNDAGELEVIIDKKDDLITVRSVSHLSLLAKAFLDSTTVISQFQDIEGTLMLLSGTEINTESGEVKRSFKIDYDNRAIVFSHGESVSIPDAAYIDADNYPLRLLQSDVNNLVGTSYLAVNPKRAKIFAHTNSIAEVVEVPAGQFNSIRITSENPDDENRYISVWLATLGDSMTLAPVKIESGTTNKKTVLTLLK